MRDIHCHIMYGIDDGSKSLEQSIEILKNAYSNGITDIVLTPHYINKSEYNCNNKNKKKILDELIGELKKEKIDINLYIGNEVMIDPDVSKLIANIPGFNSNMNRLFSILKDIIYLILI